MWDVIESLEWPTVLEGTSLDECIENFAALRPEIRAAATAFICEKVDALIAMLDDLVGEPLASEGAEATRDLAWDVAGHGKDVYEMAMNNCQFLCRWESISGLEDVFLQTGGVSPAPHASNLN